MPSLSPGLPASTGASGAVGAWLAGSVMCLVFLAQVGSGCRVVRTVKAMAAGFYVSGTCLNLSRSRFTGLGGPGACRASCGLRLGGSLALPIWRSISCTGPVSNADRPDRAAASTILRIRRADASGRCPDVADRSLIRPGAAGYQGHADPGCAGSTQCLGRFAGRGSGGHDIVHQQHVGTGHIVFPGHPEGIAYVDQAFRGEQGALFARSSATDQQIRELGDAQDLADRLGQQIGAIDRRAADASTSGPAGAPADRAEAGRASPEAPRRAESPRTASVVPGRVASCGSRRRAADRDTRPRPQPPRNDNAGLGSGHSRRPRRSGWWATHNAGTRGWEWPRRRGGKRHTTAVAKLPAGRAWPQALHDGGNNKSAAEATPRSTRRCTACQPAATRVILLAQGPSVREGEAPAELPGAVGCGRARLLPSCLVPSARPEPRPRPTPAPGTLEPKRFVHVPA